MYETFMELVAISSGCTKSDGILPTRVKPIDDLGPCCGRCKHWDRAKKRNCSKPETPVYYAECLYPVDETRIPDCVSFHETYEANGKDCPCFTAMV